MATNQRSQSIRARDLCSVEVQVNTHLIVIMEWPNLNETFKEWLISRNNNYSAATFVADGSHRRMGEMVASSLVLSHADTNATAPDTVTAEEMNRDPLSVLISITVIYSLLFLVGLVGNLITCIVISRNKSMHTATNFYLFNLAITDMLILLSAMPPELYNAWYPFQYPFDKTVCVLQGLLAETSTNVTILTISSFTIERYIAICHPFRQQAMSKLSRAIKFIVGIWIFAILAAVPQAVQFGVVEVDGHVLCTIANPSTSYAFEVSSLIFFVSPMILICMLYILIGLKLRQSHRVISKFSHRATRPRGNSTNSTAHHEMKSSLSSPSTTASGANVSYGQIAPKSTTAPKKSQRRIIKMLGELFRRLGLSRRQIVIWLMF